MEIDPTFTKGYYRRSKANHAMGNYLECGKDLKKILQLEADNKDVQKELEDLISNHLNQSQVKQLDTVLASESGKESFKRIAIVEEDEDEDEEQTPTVVPIKDTPQSGSKPSLQQSTSSAQKDQEPAAKIEGNKQNSSKDDKLRAEMEKIQKVKDSAVELINKSMYDDSITLMKKSLEFFEDDDLRLPGYSIDTQKDYLQLKVGFHSNIALCYAQLDIPSKVVDFSQIVLDGIESRRKIDTDQNAFASILEKCLLRMGFAYEKLEKFGKARECFLRVREMNIQNMQAVHGIKRCNDYLDDHRTEIPKAQPKPVSLPEPTQEKVKEIPQQPVPPRQSKAKVEEMGSMDETKTPEFLEKELKELEGVKKLGNDYFQQGNHQKAYDMFSKGISHIETNHPDIVKNYASYTEKLVKLFSMLLSNRAFACVKLKKYYNGIEDANKVIAIDKENIKIYHRKFLCEDEIAQEIRQSRNGIKDQKLQEDLCEKEKKFLQDSLKGLEIVMQSAKEDQYELKKSQIIKQIAGLEEILTEFKKKRQAPSSSKIVEETKPSTSEDKKPSEPAKKVEKKAESVKTEEQSAVKKPEPKKEETEKVRLEVTQTPRVPAPVDTSLNIDEITRHALSALISNSTLPTNASKFEVELKSFKTHYSLMWQYLSKFSDLQFLSVFYEKRELETNILLSVLACLQHSLLSE